MTRRISRLLLPTLLLMSLSACEIPFSLKDTSSPKLFVHCVPADGGTSLLVQYAAPAYGNAKTVTDFHPSSVILRVNGEPQELRADEERDGLLHCAATLLPGDEVSVEVRAEDMPDASGSSIIPPRPVIASYTCEEVQSDTLQATRVTLSLDHAPEENEYYGLQIWTRTDLVYLEDGQPSFESREGYSAPGQAFTQQELAQIDLTDYIQVDFADGLVSGMARKAPLAILTADQFQGTDYSFYLNSADLAWIYDFAGRALPGEDGWNPDAWQERPEGNKEEDTPRRVPVAQQTTCQLILHRLSTEFYYYAKAQYQSNFDFLSNMGLTPANFTWSNIRGGIGMIGAISTARTEPFVTEAAPLLPVLPGDYSSKQ